MITCKLWAQTGNQCFMIAAAISHAVKMGTTYSIPKKTINPRIWKTYFHHLPETKSATKHYYKEKRHCFDPIPEVDDLTIEGYWQSEKYWNGYKEQIAQALEFKYTPGDYVSLHIRRGDYLLYPEQFPALPIQYYHNGIMDFINKGYKHFKFYSDDIEFCKRSFPNHLESEGVRFTFSDIKDPLTDMKDMYNAVGFIIANSTFSLFPALLRSDNPVVVAPTEDRWFGPMNRHLETCDLMPERFIKR